MNRRKRGAVTPVEAWLVDKDDKVVSTHLLYGPDPEAEIIQMNKTTVVYTEGRLTWKLAGERSTANAAAANSDPPAEHHEP